MMKCYELQGPDGVEGLKLVAGKIFARTGKFSALARKITMKRKARAPGFFPTLHETRGSDHRLCPTPRPLYS
jgi:hypothetical protein